MKTAAKLISLLSLPVYIHTAYARETSEAYNVSVGITYNTKPSSGPGLDSHSIDYRIGITPKNIIVGGVQTTAASTPSIIFSKIGGSGCKSYTSKNSEYKYTHKICATASQISTNTYELYITNETRGGYTSANFAKFTISINGVGPCDVNFISFGSSDFLSTQYLPTVNIERGPSCFALSP